MSQITSTSPDSQAVQAAASPAGKPRPPLSLADLRGAALSCLLLMGSTTQPAKRYWLGQASGFGRDSTIRGLNTLADLGLARYDHGLRAWLLTESGNLFLACNGWQSASGNSGSGGLPPTGRANSIPSTGNQGDTPETREHRPENQGDTLETREHQPENQEDTLETREHRPENQGAAAGFALKEVKEVNLKAFKDSKGLKDSKNIDSSRLAPIAEPVSESRLDQPDFQEEPDTARLLEASRELFGERLFGSPARYPDARRLLAVMAQTYHHRDRFKKPARVAYSAYRQEDPPKAIYLEDPLQFLPPGFVRRAGLSQPAESSDSPGSHDPDGGAEPEYQDSPGTPDKDRPLINHLPPMPRDCCAAELSDDLAERWFRLLLIFGDLVDLVHYARYVVNMFLLKCDLENGSVVIGCCDEHHQAWLESRLRLVLERYLKASWAAHIQVSFEIYPGCGDD